jgi:hypothetical protein
MAQNKNLPILAIAGKIEPALYVRPEVATLPEPDARDIVHVISDDLREPSDGSAITARRLALDHLAQKRDNLFLF